MFSRRTRSRFAALAALFALSAAIAVPIAPLAVGASGASGGAEISAGVPQFLPCDGTPFWVSVNFTDDSSADYKLGAWVYGGKNSGSLTQVWNGTKWLGGMNYYVPIHTDSSGAWSGFVPMKLIGAPDAGYAHYLKVAVKDCADKKIYGAGNFSIVPASDCGWIEGYVGYNGIYLSGGLVEAFAAGDTVENADRNGAPAGRCFSEQNGIDDYKKFAGYFKFALPAGNYMIRFPGGAFGSVSVSAGKTVALNNRSFSYAVRNVSAFVSPDCSFEALSSEISAAQNSVCVNVYEFTNPFLCDLLRNCLLRGVSVRLLLEKSPVGGIKETENWTIKNLSENGASVRFWKKPSGSVFDHAKYAIIDNRTVIVESANWALTGVPKNSTFGNREWGIVVRDEKAAHSLLDIFESDWQAAEEAQVGDGKPPSRETYFGKYEPEFEQQSFDGNFSAKLVFSPENSLESIIELLRSASKTIFVEQLYIHTYWDNKQSPLVSELINASARGVEVRVILNYNRKYEKPPHDQYKPNSNWNATEYMRRRNISVKLFEAGEDGWGIFANVHNKGVIVDNRSVLVSSINWNENSVRNNREVGIIIENESIARYYADVFFYDWNYGHDNAGSTHARTTGTGAVGIILVITTAALAFGMNRKRAMK